MSSDESKFQREVQEHTSTGEMIAIKLERQEIVDSRPSNPDAYKLWYAQKRRDRHKATRHCRAWKQAKLDFANQIVLNRLQNAPCKSWEAYARQT